MIDTVKIQGDGYLIDDTLSVPKAEGNRHYKEVLEWIASGNEVLPEFTQEELDQQAEAEAKQAKLDALAILTVTTTAGNTFDADDVARQDMLNAISASETLGLTTAEWKLADNSWATIDVAELKEASALAIQAKGLILKD